MVPPFLNVNGCHELLMSRHMLEHKCDIQLLNTIIVLAGTMKQTYMLADHNPEPLVYSDMLCLVSGCHVHYI
jgi:hypothetical protein